MDRGCTQASRQAAVVRHVAQDRGAIVRQTRCFVQRHGVPLRKKLAQTQAHNATTCIFRLISTASAHRNPKNVHRCGVWGAKNMLGRGGVSASSCLAAPHRCVGCGTIDDNVRRERWDITKRSMCGLGPVTPRQLERRARKRALGDLNFPTYEL